MRANEGAKILKSSLCNFLRNSSTIIVGKKAGIASGGNPVNFLQ